MPNEIRIDALMPSEMATRAEYIGVRKAETPLSKVFMLAVLAGAFIALGALFATTVSTGGVAVKDPSGAQIYTAAVPWGIQRLLAGIVFSLGLTLVVVGGAELFTGNTLIVMAWANRKVTTAALLRNWTVVYLGNLVGSVATAGMVFAGKQYLFASGAVGVAALSTAKAKCELGFVQALALGVLCNALVCLAVWLTYSARTTLDKIAALTLPVAGFVAAGFEHSVANMYFVPYAMMVKAGAGPEFWAAAGKTPADYPSVNAEAFLLNNLVPVTLGNIVGGAVCVAAVYWAIFLRAAPADGK